MFEDVDARNVCAVPVNNRRSFGFPAGGSEFSLVDGGGTDGRRAPWLLPNAVTCDDRPPIASPPAPARRWRLRGESPPERIHRHCDTCDNTQGRIPHYCGAELLIFTLTV
ncbi:hypothetical protein K7G98_08920 [Saccharothrix sp. MB29]|nr:hypothetical protein [Saccharothrix sp. MB29]